MAGIADKDGGLERLGRWFDDQWPGTASVLGAVVTIVVPVYLAWPEKAKVRHHEDALALFAIGAILLLVGQAITALRGPRLSELRERLKAAERGQESLQAVVAERIADYFTLVGSSLGALAARLSFTSTDRVTVYSHDGSKFVMLGRYAEDPNLNGRGRGIQQDDQGCVGRAWRDGEAYIATLPDPVTDADAYYQTIEANWGMSQQVCQALRMKSRSYAAFRIGRPRLPPRAVIVFESTRANAFKMKDLRSEIRDYEEARLLGFLEANRETEPAPSVAREAGF